MFATQGGDGLAMRGCFPGHQVEHGSAMVAGDGGMWIGDKAVQLVRQPVITACITSGGVHPLLNDTPGLAGRDEEKAVMVELVMILHGRTVDLGSGTAGVEQGIGGRSGAVAGTADLLGSPPA